MRILPMALLLAISGLLQQRTMAQPPSPQSMRARLQQRFDATSPDIGKPLPDLTIYDADGKPFPLRKLKDHYTVLVFGCLT